GKEKGPGDGPDALRRRDKGRASSSADRPGPCSSRREQGMCGGQPTVCCQTRGSPARPLQATCGPTSVSVQRGSAILVAPVDAGDVIGDRPRLEFHRRG